jgi:hypothetical protein
MIDGGSKVSICVGVVSGFLFGVLLLNGIEYYINSLIDEGHDIPKFNKANYKPITNNSSSSHEDITITNPMHQIPMQQIISQLEEIPLIGSPKESSHNKSYNSLLEFKELYQYDPADWEEEGVTRAITAFSLPHHRKSLHTHIINIVEEINGMEDKCKELFDKSLSVRESEELAEQIDEKTHSLQYKLDHCRRYIVYMYEYIQSLYYCK